MLTLKKICSDYNILIDTSSLMDNQSTIFFKEKLYPSLEYSNAINNKRKKLIIHESVKNELERLQKNNNKKQYAKKAISIVNFFGSKKLAILDKMQGVTKNTGYADDSFKKIFDDFSFRLQLCLITQDKKLAKEIINTHPNKNALLTYINQSGYLCDWSSRLKNEQKNNFPLCAIPTTKKDTVLATTIYPDTNSIVYRQQSSSLILTKCIGKGGEGKVFLTNEKNIICKIYNKDKITTLRKEKLALMLSKKINIKGVCWPTDIALNENHEFVGYFMPQATGYTLKRSVFSRPLLNQKFPTWKKEHLIQLSITILKKIERLHDRNIIIGDMNPENILIVDEKTVFFVDTDSYQIADFPCPVGTTTFTAASIQGVSFSSILRTKENEMFAVATLIFMILFPGKAPYNHSGGGTVSQNIKDANFPYIKDNKMDSEQKPLGCWRYIWSHLHPEVKTLFAQAFKENKTNSIDKWVNELGKYSHGIKNDYSSNELFPNNYNFYDPVETRCMEDSCGRIVIVERSFFEGALKRLKYPFLCHECKTKKKLRTPLIAPPKIKDEEVINTVTKNTLTGKSIPAGNTSTSTPTPTPAASNKKPSNTIMNFIYDSIFNEYFFIFIIIAALYFYKN